MTGLPFSLLQWGRARRRGRTQLPNNRRGRTSSFNGAAPEGAEEPGVCVARTAEFLIRFNGAAPEGAEEPRSGDSQGGETQASMGPRPKARKNSHHGRGRPRGWTCFNGAAPEGAEEQTRSTSAPPSLRGSNGAAPEGAEEPSWAALMRRAADASMGPRPKARKNANNGILRRIKPSGASMGPRPKARKNVRCSCRTQNPKGCASMGPRPKARKNATAASHRVQEPCASMGPRPKARKNARLATHGNMPTSQLQWGRARRRGRTSRPTP